MCAFVLSFNICLLRGKTRAINSPCKTGRAEFTDWMYFLQSDLMEEINHNPEALTFHQHESVEEASTEV